MAPWTRAHAEHRMLYSEGERKIVKSLPLSGTRRATRHTTVPRPGIPYTQLLLALGREAYEERKRLFQVTRVYQYIYPPAPSIFAVAYSANWLGYSRGRL